MNRRSDYRWINMQKMVTDNCNANPPIDRSARVDRTPPLIPVLVL
jgi:hypothetical protein